MAYTAQTWVDGNATYPLSAARMTNIENGLVAAASVADQGGRIMSTATRDGLASVTTGTEIYNTTTGAMEVWNGSAWITTAPGAWVSYTPTLTNCTSPITAAKFARNGRTISFYVILTLTGAQVSGLIGVSLPVTAAVVAGGSYTTFFEDTGTAFYAGVAHQSTTTRVDLYATNAAGTYTAFAAPSATVPFTWAATDVIRVSGVYEAAA